MYSELEKQFQIMIKEISPSPVYPKHCIIRQVYTDGSVDVSASFGETAVIRRLKCIGEACEDSEGLLFDIGAGWNNGVVVSNVTGLLNRIIELETRIKELEEKGL